MGSPSTRNRDLGFGILCLVLAVVAGIAGSWIPLAILVVVGVVFLGRALSARR
jgi:hypothetical protein